MTYNSFENLTCEITIRDGDTVIAHGAATNHCIHDLDVHPNYRRCGYATSIIGTLMCEFDADWLWVEADNKEAVALYTGLGFKIAEKDGNYYKMYHE